MYSFGEMLKQYNETDGKCAKTWKKAALLAFVHWLITQRGK